MRGRDFFEILQRLIGASEAARCLGKVCPLDSLDEKLLNEITNSEALAAYVYATANGWHTYINKQLWSNDPDQDVVEFAKVLDSALSKIVSVAGKQSTVYRGYQVTDLDVFDSNYRLGQIITFPAFTSASFTESGAFGGNVLFIIRSLNARAIWWLSPTFHEEEALFPTNCRFEVVDKELGQTGDKDARLVVVLQELPKAQNG
jgi:hypothetical protein